MKSHYRMMILVLSLFPLGCAHLTHNHQEQALANAKASFVSENYNAAFKQLMPLARQGNAEAQYALGYLFFYGKGPQKNIEKAKYWIAKSADQRYLPAIRALNLMHTENEIAHQNNPHTLPTMTQKTVVIPTQTAVSLSTIKHPANTQILQNATPTTTPVTTNASTENATLTDIEPTHTTSFTVQLIASHNAARVREFISAKHFDQSISFFTTERDGSSWYIATLGQFKTFSSAKTAITSLPDDIKNLHPWVRRLSSLIPTTQESISPTTTADNSPNSTTLTTGDITATLENEHQATQYHSWMRTV